MPGLDPISLGLEGVGIAGSIVSSLLGNSAAKKEQAIINNEQADLNAQKQENQNFYNKDYYTNALDRTENAAAITKANQFYKERAAQDKKSAAVTGATPEAVNASKSQYSNAYANLMGNLAASGSAAKDRARQMYIQGKNANNAMQMNINNSQNQLYQGQAQNAANFGKNAAGLVSAGSNGLMTPNVNTTPAADTSTQSNTILESNKWGMPNTNF